MKIVGCTHQGPKSNNEDSYGILELNDTLLLIVADGLGGHNAGEVASKLAVKEIEENVKEYLSSTDDHRQILEKAIEKANHKIFELARVKPEYSGMGTTVVAALLDENGGVIANVGDSRAYFIDDGGIRQVTKDHSLVQSLLDMDAIDEDEVFDHPQKNVVLRSLGLKEELKADFYDVDIDEGGILLLCSDGVSDVLIDEEIKKVLANALDLKTITRNIVSNVLDKGAHDNITVVICRK